MLIMQIIIITNIANFNPTAINSFVKEIEKLYFSFGYNNVDISFKENFYERGNFSEIMKKISIHLVLDDYAALKGCANYSSILSGE